MNGELEVIKTETVIFPMKPHNDEVSEVKSIKIEETVITEVRAAQVQDRFTRLKKTLRKRSRSIL